MNSVVINICSTDVGTKLWACYQQTSWNTEPKWWNYLLTHSRARREKINGELLTCADKRIKHKVILFHFSVVGHNKWQPSIHTGVSYEVSVLHAVRTNELTLSICYLVWIKIKFELSHCYVKSQNKTKRKITNPSAKIDIVWILWNVVWVCAVVFQEAEDMLRVFKAYCAFKW